MIRPRPAEESMGLLSGIPPKRETVKRKIEVFAGDTRITAVFNSGKFLTRNEVEKVRDVLADKLQAACSELPYGIGCARNRVRVK